MRHIMSSWALGIVVLVLIGCGGGGGGGGQPVPQILYQEDFESGKATGFTLDGLWHVTRNYPAKGDYALGYVQNETQPSAAPDGSYGGPFVSAAVCWGSVTVIPDGTKAILSFDAFVGDEWAARPGFYDQFSLWASYNATTLDIPLASSAGYPWQGGVEIPEWQGSGTETYHHIVVDLSDFAGQTIYLAYKFDSTDTSYNNWPGVRIDNILITATPK